MTCGIPWDYPKSMRYWRGVGGPKSGRWSGRTVPSIVVFLFWPAKRTSVFWAWLPLRNYLVSSRRHSIDFRIKMPVATNSCGRVKRRIVGPMGETEHTGRARNGEN